MKLSLVLATLPLLTACATTAPRSAPIIDYHQHLVSPAFAPIAKLPVRDGRALVRELNAAGIERAVVLSVGYIFAAERSVRVLLAGTSSFSSCSNIFKTSVCRLLYIEPYEEGAIHLQSESAQKPHRGTSVLDMEGA